MPSTPQNVGPLLQAVADSTRLRAVELLSVAPRRAGELAGELGVSPPTMSKHLRVLLRAGVVADHRPPGDARLRMFRLRRESIETLRIWLDQLPTPHGDDVR